MYSAAGWYIAWMLWTWFLLWLSTLPGRRLEKEIKTFIEQVEEFN